MTNTSALAIKRVTETPRLAAKWLLRFLNAPSPSHLSENVWSQCQQELAAFIGSYPEFQQGLCFFAVKPRPSPIPQEQTAWLPSRKEAMGFYEMGKTLIDEFIHSPRAFRAIEEKNIQLDVSLKFFGKADPHSCLTFWVDTKQNQFLFNVYFSLGQFAPLIKTCEACSRFFLGKRTDQAFCTNQCAARSRQRKIRGTPPERFNKKGRPVGTTRKKTGKKGKATQSTGKKK